MSQLRLQRIEKWIKSTFEPDSEPHPATVRRWCEQGKIASRKVGGQWFIDIGADEAVQHDLAASTDNPVAADLLSSL